MTNPNVGDFELNDLVEGTRMLSSEGKHGFITSVTNPSRDGQFPIAVRWHDGTSSSEWCGSLVKLTYNDTGDWEANAKMSLNKIQLEIEDLSSQLASKLREREVIEGAILIRRN